MAAARRQLLDTVYAAVQTAARGHSNADLAALVAELQCWNAYYKPFELKTSEKQFLSSAAPAFQSLADKAATYQKVRGFLTPAASGAFLWQQRLVHFAQQSAAIEGNSLSINDSMAVTEMLKNSGALGATVGSTWPDASSLARALPAVALALQEKRDDITELRNSIIAAEYCIQHFVQRDLSIGWTDVQVLHRLLPRDTADTVVWGHRQEAGSIRTLPMQSRGFPHIIYPYPSEIPTLLREMWRWQQSGECAALPPVLQAARAHALFIQLHPFYDGNGRAGRLLMAGLLARAGYPPFVMQQLNTAEYVAALDAAHSKGEGSTARCMSWCWSRSAIS